MAGGYDLIGPKVKSNGAPAGMDVRAGDAWHSAPNPSATEPLNATGPVVAARDPLTNNIRYFRFVVQLVNNGDGTTTAVSGVEEVFL